MITTLSEDIQKFGHWGVLLGVCVFLVSFILSSMQEHNKLVPF